MDVNKQFELANEKYQELKNKMVMEKTNFTDKVETLNNEIEGLKASKFLVFHKCRNKYNVHAFKFLDPF